MYRWFLALRYLLSRPINVLGMIGVLLGTWAMILVVAIFSGFLSVVTAHVRAAGADISVRQVPAAVPYPELRAIVRQDPNVAACAGRLVQTGLLNERGKLPGPLPLPGRGALQGGDGPFLYAIGVDPAAEREVTGFADWVRDVPETMRVRDPEHPLAPLDGLPALLLGIERMRSGGLAIGTHVVFTCGRTERGADADAATLVPQRQEFVVAGAFHTQHAGFDSSSVFADLAALRALVADDRPELVTEVCVKTKDDQLVDATAARLQSALRRGLTVPVDPRQLVVETWRQRDHLFLSNIEYQRGLMKVVLVLIMVPATVLLFATLSMMTSEKTGDIGILCALGGTPRGIAQLFLGCGLAITTLGVALGVAAGCLSAIHLDDVHRLLQDWFGIDLFPIKVYNLDRVPYELDAWWTAQVAAMAFVFGGVAAGVPAWLVARHDPLESLRGI